MASLDILGLPREELVRHVAQLHGKPGKGAWHADALFRDLHVNGRFAPEELPEFADNPALAARVRAAFHLNLPEISGREGDGNTYKFLLRLEGAENPPLESESVVIPMKAYKTLCV